jgi:hypothetical protein
LDLLLRQNNLWTAMRRVEPSGEAVASCLLLLDIAADAASLLQSYGPTNVKSLDFAYKNQ